MLERISASNQKHGSCVYFFKNPKKKNEKPFPFFSSAISRPFPWRHENQLEAAFFGSSFSFAGSGGKVFTSSDQQLSGWKTHEKAWNTWRIIPVSVGKPVIDKPCEWPCKEGGPTTRSLWGLTNLPWLFTTGMILQVGIGGSEFSAKPLHPSGIAPVTTTRWKGSLGRSLKHVKFSVQLLLVHKLKENVWLLDLYVNLKSTTWFLFLRFSMKSKLPLYHLYPSTKIIGVPRQILRDSISCFRKKALEFYLRWCFCQVTKKKDMIHRSGGYDRH